MSREERYGERDLAYSSWHRTIEDEHEPLDYIDIDAVEYCHNCKKPLALIELAQDIGQKNKPTTVTRILARRADIPAYLVFYKKNQEEQIEGFRVRMVSPRWGKEKEMSVDEYVNFLFSLREKHREEKEREREVERKKWEGVKIDR